MYRYRFAVASLALAALCATGRADAVGEVYKWTDEDGVVHYTDAPPDDKPFTTKQVKAPSVPTPATEAGETAAATGTPPAEASKTPAQRNCEIARKNLENLNAHENITADRNNDGVPEPLTADERATEIKRSESLIEVYCEPQA